MKTMKKTLSLFLSFTLALGLTACQQTPEDALVAQKDKNRLESAAAETAGPENTLKTLRETTPKTYSYSYHPNEETTIRAVDVPVELPDTDTIPTYRVSSGVFSQELVTNLYDFLFQGEKTYQYVGEDFTKSDIEATILKLKQDLAEIEASDELSEDEKDETIESTKELIKEYEEMYKDAPEEPTLKKVECDSTLQISDTRKNPSELSRLECSTESGSTLSVENYSSDSDFGSNLSYDKRSGIHYGSGGDEIPVTEKEAGSELADSIGISYEDAKKQADELFQAAGVDARLLQSYLKAGFTEEGDNSNPFYGESTLTDEENYSAFHFYYARVIDGMETASTNLVYSMSDEDMNDFTSPWNFEIIDLLVTKNGIEKIHWDSPPSIDEVLSENVGPLSFQEAAEIFEKMMPTIYYGASTRYTIVDITSIKLCYMQIRDNGTERSGLLIPVWAFYGNWYVKDPSDSGNGELHMEPPYILLAVNAMDGTIINTRAGY